MSVKIIEGEATRLVRPFSELRDSGLLWLINRAVFHPRGFALGVVISVGGEVTGWRLLGDGSEPWQFGGDEDEHFQAAEATLNAHRLTPTGDSDG